MIKKFGIILIIFFIYTTSVYSLETFMTGVQKAEEKNTIIFGGYLGPAQSLNFGKFSLISFSFNASLHFALTDDLTLGIMVSDRNKCHLKSILRLNSQDKFIPEISLANSIGIKEDSDFLTLSAAIPFYWEFYFLNTYISPHLELVNYVDTSYTFRLNSGITYGFEVELGFLTLGVQGTNTYEPLVSNMPVFDEYPPRLDFFDPTRNPGSIYIEIKI